MPSAAEASPVAPTARIATLDILRGLALFGMLLAHFHKLMGEGNSPDGNSGVIGTVITMGVAEKDRAMFAFLFGVGFAVMLRRLEARQLPVVTIFLRRLVVLYLIGFAVDVLTKFYILREYAWWGIPLLFLRHYPTRQLLAIAVIGAAAFSIRDVTDSLYSVATTSRVATVAREKSEAAQFETQLQAQTALESGPDYVATVAARFNRCVRETFRLMRLVPTLYLALFIFGLLAVRHGIIDKPKAHVRLIATVMGLGLFCWICQWWILAAISSDFVTPRVSLALRGGGGILDEQLLAFTYLGGVLLLTAYFPRWQTHLAPLGWVGRMALTNYIVQAAVIDYASSAYGLGLRISPVMEIVAATGMFALQIGYSRWWFSQFRFGPVEWTWRSLTYWHRQPMRN